MRRGNDLVIAGPGHRRGVDEEKFNRVIRINAFGARIVARRHVPALALLAVGDLCVAVPVIIMVAEDDVPRHLAAKGADIHLFKRAFWPLLRIIHRSDAVLVKIIPHGDDEFSFPISGCHRHLRGHVQLILLALAAPVAEDDEVQARPAGHQKRRGCAATAGRPSPPARWRRTRCERNRGGSVS